MSLLLRQLIKTLSTESKYRNGGLRHFVGSLYTKSFPECLKRREKTFPAVLEQTHKLHSSLRVHPGEHPCWGQGPLPGHKAYVGERHKVRA